MSWKIFNIGKANERIAELEKEVAALKAAPVESDKRIAELAESNKQISDLLEKANSDLAAEKAAAAAKASELNEKLSAASKEHTEAIAKMEASVKEKAAQVAQTITASVGAPPVPSVPQDAQDAKAASTKTGAGRLISAAINDLKAAGYQKPGAN